MLVLPECEPDGARAEGERHLQAVRGQDPIDEPDADGEECTVVRTKQRSGQLKLFRNRISAQNSKTDESETSGEADFRSEAAPRRARHRGRDDRMLNTVVLE